MRLRSDGKIPRTMKTLLFSQHCNQPRFRVEPTYEQARPHKLYTGRVMLLVEDSLSSYQPLGDFLGETTADENLRLREIDRPCRSD